MRILINKTSTETEKYSLLSTCKIEPITHETTKQDVIALIEDENFEESLKTAINLNIPVVAIVNRDSKFYDQAIELIHPAGVVYYENEKILSARKVFAEAEGVTVKTLETICQYALDNKLYPEIYVWKPQKEIINFRETKREEPKKEIKQEVKETKQKIEPKQKTQENTEPTKRKKTYTPAQTDLESYIKCCDHVIAIFKTSQSADSGQVAFELAKQLGTVHLNISTEPNQRQGIYYAYSDGNIVNYNSSIVPGKYLVAEVDAQIPEALELIYGIAHKIVHVVADPEESLEPLRAWTGSGFKLDAVIPNETKNIPAYNEFPAYSVTDFLKLL